MQRLLLITSLFASLFSTHAKSEIYRFIDENGKVTYSDQRLTKKFVHIERTWKGWVKAKYHNNYAKNRKRFQPYINDAAARHGIHPKLIHAVIHTESHYNPVVKSHAGAVGLMQLMPATAQRYGVNNRKNPEQNIDGGVRYLKDLIKMFNNDLTLVLAAYNAGENAVKRYGNKIPPYPETQNYVKKVLKIYKG